MLGTVLVLTGVPMNAKEVKAEGSTLILDFGNPTHGVVSPIDGSVGAVVHDTGTTYGSQQLTPQLKGNLN